MSRVHMARRIMDRRVLGVLLGLDSVLLIRILWFPVDPEPSASPWWMRWVFFNHIPGGHYLLNCLLLVPTALLLTALWPRWTVLRVTLLCFAISCLAEAGQFLVPTRMPDVWDLATNTAGAAVVAWAVRVTRRRRDDR